MGLTNALGVRGWLVAMDLRIAPLALGNAASRTCSWGFAPGWYELTPLASPGGFNGKCSNPRPHLCGGTGCQKKFVLRARLKIPENFCGTFNALCYIHALSNGLDLAIQARHGELRVLAPIP